MHAYSRLKRLLNQQRLSVPELHRRIRSRGLAVNVKSLYRLKDDSQPIDRLDMRIAGAICEVCGVRLSDWIVFEEDSGTLRSLTAEQQSRLAILMAGNNQGHLKDVERDELRALVREAEEVTVANARLLAQQQQQLERDPEGVSLAS